MAAADYIGYGDAASTASKVGIYVVDQFWASFSFPATHYYDQQRRTLITIALLEMSAIVALALLAARHLSPRAHGYTHVHIVTDNTNAYYQALSNQSTSPLLYLFLQMLNFISASANIMFTYSWTPSGNNPIADAISRDFRTAAGPTSMTYLRQHCQHVPIPPAFMTTMLSASSKSQTTATETLQWALTPLRGTSSLPSVPPPTKIHPTPTPTTPRSSATLPSMHARTLAQLSHPESSIHTSQVFVPPSNTSVSSLPAPSFAPRSSSNSSPHTSKNTTSDTLSARHAQSL